MHSILLHALTMTNGDWTIRLDPRHGNNAHHRKHVHITKKGLKGEYSWNDDGSRHDKHKFPLNEKCIKKAKKLASDALRIPQTSLSLIVSMDGGCDYKFSSKNERFTTYVRKTQHIVVFEQNNDVVTIILSCDIHR